MFPSYLEVWKKLLQLPSYFKEKDYDIYLKSEKLVQTLFPSYLDVGKTRSQQYRA